jgi:GT2 family glycosyltransferase
VTAGSAPPLVVAAVLNWKRPDDTVRCVRSLLECGYPRLVPVVVDNASGDASCALIEEALPGVELLRNSRNLGYAGGNNVAIRRSLEVGAAYVMVLNNDAVVATGCVGRLVEALESRPRAAQVVPMVCAGATRRVESAGGEIRWPTAEPRLLHHGAAAEEVEGVREVEFAPGVAVLCRSAAIREAGLMEEDYFLYFEDVDWSMRFRRAGWSVIADPEACATHWESSSSAPDAPMKLYYYVRNNLRFIDRHVSLPNRRAVRARFAGKMARLAGRRLLRLQGTHLRAMRLGWRDHVRGIAGPMQHRL